MDPQRRGRLPRGRGRAVAAAARADRRAVPGRRRLLAARDPAGEELCLPVPVPASRHPRPVHRPRPDPVLRLLRPVYRWHVLRHRRLGARRAGPRRGGQVLPVHLHRLAGAAARVHRPVPRRPPAHLRHGRPDCRGPAGWPRRLRRAGAAGGHARAGDQDPGGAVPHLAAARPHRGAGGRVGDPGRGAAEDGHLRVLPDRDADAAGRVAPLRRGVRRRRGGLAWSTGRWSRSPRPTSSG